MWPRAILSHRTRREFVVDLVTCLFFFSCFTCLFLCSTETPEEVPGPKSGSKGPGLLVTQVLNDDMVVCAVQRLNTSWPSVGVCQSALRGSELTDYDVVGFLKKNYAELFVLPLFACLLVFFSLTLCSPLSFPSASSSSSSSSSSLSVKQAQRQFVKGEGSARAAAAQGPRAHAAGHAGQRLARD